MRAPLHRLLHFFRREPGARTNAKPVHLPLFKHPGHCPVCGGASTFTAHGEWLRDEYQCDRCHSIPRERALIAVLDTCAPHWRELRLHESSPGRPASAKLQRECSRYTSTHFFPGVQPGTLHRGFRCENLEAQTFPDAAFDLVITQDVMEHVLDPPAAFHEIARTLAPGGMHVFTTPVYSDQPTTRTCARRGPDGGIELLEPAEYHGNPIDNAGSLVTIRYGADIAGYVERVSGLPTTVHRLEDRQRGLLGALLEVMVSVKRTPVEN